jgi:hypothetical protein
MGFLMRLPYSSRAKKHPTTVRRTVMAALVLGILGLGRPGANEVTPVLVIVVSQTTNLVDVSAQELRRIFLGEVVHDAAGNKLIPLNQLPGSVERTTFDQRILAMSRDEMARFWIDRKVRGQKSAPRPIAPPRTLALLVAKFGGTITYLRTTDVMPGLRTVKVDGRGPQDPGYPLRLPGGT